MAETSGVRRWGAASLDLAFVAAGRYEGFWEVGLKPWDKAAGILLVAEAGGFVTEITGGRNLLHGPDLLATNVNLHQALAKLLIAAAAPPKG
jgi:myo-inositol-1(or 4)-monophosphatase